MKAEFEITTTKDGTPAIKFTHSEASNDLEQILLKLFIDQAKEHGIKLTANANDNFVSMVGNNESYLIIPDKK